jgi:putative alpha-1,2-mannosidase
MLWMAAPAGCPEVGQRFLRQVRFCHTDRNENERAPGFVLTNVSNALWQATRQFYGPEFYSGDEDNGSMAAWYLLSALGLYQLVPGSLDYSIGSPMFRHVKLSLDNGKVLQVKAPANSAEAVYVKSVAWNGEALPALAIGFDKLMEGGTLLFEMTDDPEQVFRPPLV